ncbi:MAG: hypothetical protein EHM64_10080, partial [Ignavibacteriae bacterium]
MHKHHFQITFLLLCFFQISAPVCFGETVVFFEKGFPSQENGTISRTALEKALSPLHPRFVGLAELQQWNAQSPNDLLILPYGSAFPADAWEAIQKHLAKGNLLVLGGRPLFVPVTHVNGGWRSGNPQNTYARSLGIEHSYAVPQKGSLQLL